MFGILVMLLMLHLLTTTVLGGLTIKWLAENVQDEPRIVIFLSICVGILMGTDWLVSYAFILAIKFLK